MVERCTLEGADRCKTWNYCYGRVKSYCFNTPLFMCKCTYCNDLVCVSHREINEDGMPFCHKCIANEKCTTDPSYPTTYATKGIDKKMLLVFKVIHCASLAKPARKE